MNYKSAAVANARFHQIKRAVIKASDAAAPGSPPPPSPAKRVEKIEKAKEEAEGGKGNGIVKKRGRGRPRKVKVPPAAPTPPVGGEEGRGKKAFGEDFGGGAAGVEGGGGGIDPRVLGEMGSGDRMEEEDEDETEIEGEKGGRVGFGL